MVCRPNRAGHDRVRRNRHQGEALLLLWVVAEATARWSAVPDVRAIVGVGLGAAVGALALAAKRVGHQAEPRATNGSENTSGAAEPGDAPPLTK